MNNERFDYFDAMTALTLVLIIAAVAAFCIMLIEKTGVRNAVTAHASRLIGQMFGCDFCLSWWTCLAMACIAAAYTHDWKVIMLAVVAAPVARRLIS